MKASTISILVTILLALAVAASDYFLKNASSSNSPFLNRNFFIGLLIAVATALAIAGSLRSPLGELCRGLDPALEEAALDLGATPLRAFWLVIVPALRPAIVAGARGTRIIR